MAYTQFPNYAQLVFESDYTVRPVGGVERTEMEDGFIEQVPIQSLTRYETELNYRLDSQARKLEFEAWRVKDLAMGTRFFAWPDVEDPSGGTLRRARIVGGSVTYKALTERLDEYSVSFSLEYWA